VENDDDEEDEGDGVQEDQDVPTSEEPSILSVSVETHEEERHETLFMDGISVSESFSEPDHESNSENFPEDSDHINFSFDDEPKQMEADPSVDDSQAQTDALPESSRIQEPVNAPEHVSSQLMDSLEYSTAPLEWDSNEFNISDAAIDLPDLDEDFNGSQIIAESPDDFSFDHNFDDGKISDDNEHEHADFIQTMTKLDFSSDQNACDSSGGGKTITTTSTAETAPMSAEDLQSDEGSTSSCEHEDEHDDDDGDKGNVLGIVRRDTYIPTIDSPVLPNKKQFGDELDYLESKVKALGEKLEHDTNNRFDSEFPIQMSREPIPDIDSNIVEKENYIHPQNFVTKSQSSSVSEQTTVRKTSLDISTEVPVEKKEIVTPQQEEPSIPRSRRHPTAARLKALRQSNAWKRRYARIANKD
jgi:hypothetical protein